MKINKLKINSYGKIKNKEIELNDGINIIYGKNESGKSTILNFIFNSFYGVSKNKKGKNISDYDKFKPIDTEEFSGKMEYELDNNEKFEIYRDFNKKNPKIFNEKSEDISKEFNIDKKTGNEFFYEQTKVDEDLFISTVGILQKNIELEKNNQNYLIQKLANLVGTGEDNVSYKRAIDRINRRQLGEIGTDRSREKPINIINKNIDQLNNEKNNLEEYKNKKYEIAEEENNLLNNQEKLKNKNNYLSEIKLFLEKENIEKEKINLKENTIKENNEKINLLNNKLIEEKNKINLLEKNKIEENKLNEEKIKKEINNSKNKLNKKLIIYFIILLIINLLIILLINNNYKYIFLLTVPIFLIFSILIKNKLNKKIKNKYINYFNNEKNNNEINNINDLNNIENQINLLKINNENLINEINNSKNNFNLKNNLEIEKIKNKYKNNYLNNEEKNTFELNNNINDSNNLINYINNLKINLENILLEKEKINNELNNNEIELHKLKLNKENVEPQLDELSKIEEQLNYNYEQKNNLEKTNKSIEIAKQTLEEAYEQMKENITPKFTNNLSQIISVITSNKYNKIKFNEENGIMVELKNGDYIGIDNLSVGTIEQLYLSLRISMIDELSEEKLPLFLDETFAYYDDERLQNVLVFLVKEAIKRQIFIFTCSKREIEMLNSLNIKYNLVELN